MSGRPRSFTKAALAEAVARVIDISREDAGVIVDAIFNGIVGALSRGDKVELRGFGTFTTYQRRAHRGRNPKTGASVAVPPKRVSHFKASRSLLGLINQ